MFNQLIFKNMEKKNALRWTPKKNIMFDGRACVIELNVSLDDDCHNKHCDFSITSLIKLKNPKTSYEMRDPCVAGGCNHDDIVKYFPELKKFTSLHLCGHAGEPMYPVENGIYHIKDKKDVAMEYLRITEEEYDKLLLAVDDKLYFRHLLFHLGIVDRWKKEADEFIAFLEEKCGCKWENPYKPEEERCRLEPLTGEEKALLRERFTQGYYSVAAINGRKREAELKQSRKEYDKVWAEYREAEDNARRERDAKLCVLNYGLPLSNMIFYTHSNTLRFNWRDYEKKITREQFDDFVANCDKSLLPNDVKFIFGDEKK